MHQNEVTKKEKKKESTWSILFYFKKSKQI